MSTRRNNIIFIVSIVWMMGIYPIGFLSKIWKAVTGEVNGAATYTDTTLEELRTVNGACTANKTKIKKNMSVSGHAKLEDSHLYGTFTGAGTLEAVNTIFEKKVDVSGSVEAKESTFKGHITVKGTLTASRSIFNDIVHVRGGLIFSDDTEAKDIIVEGDINLRDSHVNNITVESLRKGKVILRGKNTKVHGSITFESGEGVVYLDDQIALDKNQVHGGIIKERKK